MLAVAARRSGWMLSLALVAMPLAAADKLSPAVRLAAATGRPVEVLIEVAGDADLERTPPAGSHAQKVASAGQRLREVAARTQAGLIDELKARGIEHRSYWVANIVWARVTLDELERIASRDEVLCIDGNPMVREQLPLPEFNGQPPEAPNAIEWGVARVRAPDVWALGYTGQGVVIGGQDTGYQWDHPALRDAYRGWNGTTADHNYNWHDAIHALIGGGTNPCGLDSQVPCDDHNHGTHTMGTMVGDDGGANQIGVAPDARWISCRNMERGNGTPATYLECFQWFLAPTDLAGQNPDPARAPHVINNSWGCPPSEGCSFGSLQSAVDNLRAAGILVVVSAGNSGSGCSSVIDPPAIYASSFSVGNTTSAVPDGISASSSRGPVTIDGSNRLKPDVSAPGSSVRSSIRNSSYGTFSGTSMAGPHVAAVAALIMSARPDLRGNPPVLEQILRDTAVQRTSTQNCGAYAGANVPNAVFGWGRVDALNAVQRIVGPNTPPGVTAPATTVLVEDVASADLPVPVSDAETPAATLQLSATSTNPALVPGSALVLGGSGATRSVRVVPAADQHGSATVTLTVLDSNYASASASFTVQVQPVNDAPAFSLASNPTHAGGAVGAQSVNGFVTSFNPGPNEAAQLAAEYVVSETADPANLVEGAAISAAGVLSYTLNGNPAGGTASFSAVVRDDGGTSNGGVDTSTARTFSITVAATVDALFANGFE